ncbi:hypothetical protein [Actinoplanes sp. GCM10030250]|uniref:hypothetical protein n=1 Tax=Actinoplanes sp. GCM10030250 TaxID=3273376 RepID=UPI00361787AB
MMRLNLRTRSGRRALTEPSPASADIVGATYAGTVYAVRRDWPDGTHEFVGPGTTMTDAADLWNSQHNRWRRSSWRPHLCVVLISGRNFWLHAHHRNDCRAPDCPTTGAPA